MTPPDLKAIRAACEKATPHPFSCADHEYMLYHRQFPEWTRALLARVEALEAAMREILDDLAEILDEPGVRGEGSSSPERSLEIARRALEGGE